MLDLSLDAGQYRDAESGFYYLRWSAPRSSSQHLAIQVKEESAVPGLEPVIAALHDRWFDLDAVTFDRDAMLLTIPFWSPPTMRYPRDASGQPKPFDRRMTIQGVRSYNVEDRERIGIYSFNTMERTGEVLMITADPHVTITVVGKNTSLALDEMEEGESAGSR